MPKIKTHRGVAKRFKLTASGKVKARKAFANHILTKKSSKRKRNLNKGNILSKAETAVVRRMLPNG
ncbi:MAG: 50S ribosomal protein L35 [bacterium]